MFNSSLLKKSISFSLTATIKHFFIILLFALIMSALDLARILMITNNPSLTQIVLATLAFALVSAILTQGILTILLRIHRGLAYKVSDLVSSTYVFKAPSFLFLSFLTLPLIVEKLLFVGEMSATGVALPITFLIVGISVILYLSRVQFSVFAFVDKEKGILQSLDHSWSITRVFIAESLVFAILISVILIGIWSFDALTLHDIQLQDQTTRDLLYAFDVVSLAPIIARRVLKGIVGIFVLLCSASMYDQLLQKTPNQ